MKTVRKRYSASHIHSSFSRIVFNRYQVDLEVILDVVSRYSKEIATMDNQKFLDIRLGSWMRHERYSRTIHGFPDGWARKKSAPYFTRQKSDKHNQVIEKQINKSKKGWAKNKRLAFSSLYPARFKVILDSEPINVENRCHRRTRTDNIILIEDVAFVIWTPGSAIGIRSEDLSVP